MTMERVTNIFTVDLEDWFHANYHGSPEKAVVSTVESNTSVLLDLLDRHETKATFFCLGQIAVSHPSLIKRIGAAGHEVASHGQNHQLVYQQTPAEFREDVLECKQRLEEITGRAVLGYRAPSWSITAESLWALDVLESLGFAYDSSIFPMKTFLYGIQGAPRFPYRPSTPGASSRLVEIPPSTVAFLGKTMGFGGGFYLRSLPLFIQIMFSRSLNNSGRPFLIYIHPREIDPQQPRLKLTFKEHLIHYWGIRHTFRKLDNFLSNFSFAPMSGFLSGLKISELPLCNPSVVQKQDGGNR